MLSTVPQFPKETCCALFTEYRSLLDVLDTLGAQLSTQQTIPNPTVKLRANRTFSRHMETPSNSIVQRKPSTRRIVLDDGAEKREVQTLLLHWNELEDWQKDNEYIIHGYRRPQYNWRGCLKSVYAYLHNETVNIHSHLWGAALFAYLLATFYPTYIELHDRTTWKDATVIGIFLSSAIICLAASAFYHTSGCHSREAASHYHAYDYSGIIILIVGSFVPSIYYGFFCSPLTQKLYLTTMTLAGMGAAFIVLDPEYAKPTHRGARTTIFIGLGLCAIVPVTQLFLTHGLNELVSDMGVHWLLISGTLYIAGALLYANRIPERLAPGRFDFFFASHQIFHFCVILAALAHYQGVLISLQYRLSQPSCRQ